MKSLRTNQSGFTAIEGFLIILIVIIVGTLGWYVLKTKNNNSTVYTNTPSTTSNGATTKTAKVFKFKELGVEISLPSDGSLNHLTYGEIDIDYSNANNKLGKSPTAWLSTTDFNKAEGGACSVDGVSADMGLAPPMGFLTRTNGEYPTHPSVDNSTGTLIKQFGTYYIAWRSNGGQPCFKSSSLNEQAGKLSTNQLQAALKTVKEIK